MRVLLNILKGILVYPFFLIACILFSVLFIIIGPITMICDMDHKDSFKEENNG